MSTIHEQYMAGKWPNLAMDGKIYDHQGNWPNRVQAKLYSAGWRIYMLKHRGMFKIIHWIDPLSGNGMTQGDAYNVLKCREKYPNSGQFSAGVPSSTK